MLPPARSRTLPLAEQRRMLARVYYTDVPQVYTPGMSNTTRFGTRVSQENATHQLDQLLWDFVQGL